MRTAVSLLVLSLTAPGITSQATATALASDEFDEDGRPDLVCAYAAGDEGLLALYTREGARFARDARVTPLPLRPDAIATGDFDNDGHRDVVAATLGGSAVVLLPGDGRGRFGAPRAL